MAGRAGGGQPVADSGREDIARCPRCGERMEPGVLGAESLVGGAKWMRKRSRLAIGGEGLASPDTWGNVYFDGFRCRSCRVLVLEY